MVGVYVICGDWKFGENHQWEFEVDLSRRGSFSVVDEDITYENFLRVVKADLGMDDIVITLTYRDPLMTGSLGYDTPFQIRNDRQVKGFFIKMKEAAEILRLFATIENFTQQATICTNISSSKQDQNEQLVVATIIQVPRTPKQNRKRFLTEQDIGVNTHSTTTYNQTEQDIGVNTHSTTTYNQTEPVESNISVTEATEETCSTAEKGNYFSGLLLVDLLPVPIGLPASTAGNNDIRVNQYFKSKEELMQKMRNIHPCGDLSTCSFPDGVYDYLCCPPNTKLSSRRPPKKRKRAAGEFGVLNSKSQGHKCSICGTGGHNKTTCRNQI
ncbi:unnamed protein product, partial [Thlaspi arvense]